MTENILREARYDDFPGPVRIANMSDGRDISFQTRGEKDGYPIFFLHGSPGSRLGPLPRFTVLYQNGINLISTDRPGYGRSDRHQGRTVADTAHDIEELADALDIGRFGVIGRSGGAAHALGCAALLSDRVQSVIGLEGMSPPQHHERLKGMVRNNKRIHGEVFQNESDLHLELGRLAILTKDDPEAFLRDFLWEQMPQADQEMFEDAAIRKIQIESYYEALAPQGATGWVEDIVAANKPWGFDLNQIRQPTRLLHGELDSFSPYSNSCWIIEQIKAGGNLDATVRIQPNEAHFYGLKFMLDALRWQRNLSS